MVLSEMCCMYHIQLDFAIVTFSKHDSMHIEPEHVKVETNQKVLLVHIS